MLHRMRPAVAGLVLLAFSAACSDNAGGPASPIPPQDAPAAELARLECTVTVADGGMRCSPAAPSTGPASGLVVGGPNGTYVNLTASNHSFLAGDNVYSIDVTVQNLLFQALGTTDGATPDPKGVMVLFDVEPYPTGGDMGASMELLGESRDLLMRADQAYYTYSQVLQPNQTSMPMTWEFSKPAAVSAFRFVVYVMAAVPFPVGRVDITPAADTLLEGATTTLTATVRNAYGQTANNQVVAWGTSDAAVATVDASGVVTAVAPGTATITGTSTHPSGDRTGQVSIVVCPDLAVGEAYTLTMPAASSVCLGGAAGAAAEYVYMPVNLSQSSALSLSVTGTGIVAAAGPPAPALLPSGSSGLEVRPNGLTTDDALHGRMLEQDRALAARLGRNPASRIDRGARRGGGGARMTVTPGVPAVGDLWSLNTASGCTGTPSVRTGRVVSVGAHVIIVADTMNPAGGFTQAQYDSIALEFDTIAWPSNADNFGAPEDVDLNNRVVAFYTRAVNELSPPASSVVVNGFFSARDLFSSDPASCPLSNEGEMFYMLVPDPTGAVNSNVRTVSSVRGGTVATMGHELQHLVNASRRIYVNEPWNGVLEQVWLNEGLSHIAEEAMFFRTAPGLAVRGNVSLSSLQSAPNASRKVAAFNTYLNQNFGRFRTWLQRPDTAGAFKNTDHLAVRGAIWAFLRYAADRRNGTDAQLWFNLVNTGNTGVANLQEELGVDPNLWLRDFVSALYVDDAVGGIGPEQQITSFNFRSIYSGLGGFPLGVRTPSNGVALTLSYSRGGAAAYHRFGVPADGFASVTALSGGVVPSSPFQLIIVRTK